MLNWIWLGLVLSAVVLGGVTDHLPEVTKGALDAAETAVMKLALPLAGLWTLWLGMMRLAEKAGLIQQIASMLRPLMVRLFPDVPGEHPAMGSMVMNMAANMLGLSNAATPLGLRAMRDLERLNPHPGIATNAMCTFLAINTASIQLIPTTAISILAARGSHEPTAIIGTALLASACATISALIAVKLLQRLPLFGISASEPGRVSDSTTAPNSEAATLSAVSPAPMTAVGKVALVMAFLFFSGLFVRHAFPEWCGLAAPEGESAGGFMRVVRAVSLLAVPAMLCLMPLYAAVRRIKVYEEFIEGAKEGFQVALRVIPFLVAILTAIGMFRAAGGIELVAKGLSPVLNRIGFPVELLPMVLVRPLSGSGTIGLFTDLVSQQGADHILSRMGATILGSTETTFYVLAVYFGSVGVRRTRHAVPAGLVADVVGVIASISVCRLMFG